jgi:ATP phosphoribosyltransferase
MMKVDQNALKIAIQKSGRLTTRTVDLLQRCGLDFESYDNRLFSSCRNFPLEILFVRDDDIPEYVQDGVCDLGIVGENVVAEKGAEVKTLEALGYGRCRLALAVPQNSGITATKDLVGKTIATSYPKVLRQFLTKAGVAAEVMVVSGSVEITPSLQVADAICDLVSTGTTLRTNGLREMQTILESETKLIVNEKALNGPLKMDLERLLMRIRGVLTARRTKYVMMNAPETALAEIESILPGLESPTVMPLAEQGMIAIHSVVPEETFWEDIERLKAAGATGILVVPIEKMIL